VERLIENSKIIVCVGSGGVGKTTLSSCIGIKAAQLGYKTLILTIDPAKRLATSLGIENNEADITRVPNQNFKGELYAGLIDHKKVFEKFIHNAAKDKSKAEKLLNNRLYKQLSTTFSGSQEFTALEKLAEVFESGDFDKIILDTPPAQHALDFLTSPEKIYSLFNDSITKWFIGGAESNGFWQNIVNKGTQIVFKALEKITGSQFIGELSDFFESIKSFQDQVAKRSFQVKEILKNKTTSFILITGFDEIKLKEANELSKKLSEMEYNLKAVIVNRAFPQWAIEPEVVIQSNTSNDELKELYNKFFRYHQVRLIRYNEFQSQVSKEIPVVRVPDLNKDIYGLANLGLLSEEIEKRFT